MSRGVFGAGVLALVIVCGTALPIPTYASDSSARAGLVITEIMYDVPGANTDRQWVEVANTGTSVIDLGDKTLRLFDKSSTGTKDDGHLIKSFNGSTVFARGAVAVIAENPDDFLADWPAYKGTLLKSAFNLTAAGTVGFMSTDGTVLNSVTYSSAEGAKGDGNSLQMSATGVDASRGAGSDFKAGAPTPGIVPATIPAALISAKQLSASKSSTKQGKATKSRAAKTKKAVTSKTHAKGTLAPADSADAASAGAFGDDGLPAFSFSLPQFFTPYIPLFESAWFAAFLALLCFSGFSLMVIQKQYAYE